MKAEQEKYTRFRVVGTRRGGGGGQEDGEQGRVQAGREDKEPPELLKAESDKIQCHSEGPFACWAVENGCQGNRRSRGRGTDQSNGQSGVDVVSIYVLTSLRKLRWLGTDYLPRETKGSQEGAGLGSTDSYGLGLECPQKLVVPSAARCRQWLDREARTSSVDS